MSSWYGGELLWALVQCSVTCVIDSLGDCNVAQSPLTAEISRSFQLKL